MIRMSMLGSISFGRGRWQSTTPGRAGQSVWDRRRASVPWWLEIPGRTEPAGHDGHEEGEITGSGRRASVPWGLEIPGKNRTSRARRARKRGNHRLRASSLGALGVGNPRENRTTTAQRARRREPPAFALRSRSRLPDQQAGMPVFRGQGLSTSKTKSISLARSRKQRYCSQNRRMNRNPGKRLSRLIRN